MPSGAHHSLPDEPASSELTVQCYLYTDQYSPQGWYDKAERTPDLAIAFRW